MAKAISRKWRGLAALGVLLGIALVIRPLHALAADTLVEFHNTTLDHYFLTIDPAEAAAIDSGTAGPGWQRTGQTIAAYQLATAAPAGSAVVCRFYGNQANGGPNGHFYTADAAECAAVKLDPGWTFERNEFHVQVPASGNCPAGSVPVLRAYNGRFAEHDSNHRYTTDLATYDQMLARGWKGEGVVFCGAAATPAGYNPLWIPPLLSGTTANGTTTYDLTLAASSKQLVSGTRTATYGYNGSEFWGPTVIMNKGDLVRMRVQNNLAEATTTHWHGLLVSGAVDGGPHQIIAAGGTWLTDAFRVKNQAATYWYHPHMHEMTQKQLTLGAGGLIIIRDAAEATLDLPRAYGSDDIPLVLTSRRFTTANGVANQFQYIATAYGDFMLTNGVTNALASLPKQLVRLRILNAEIERNYNLGFSDNRTFRVIGNDGGLLSAPVTLTRLIMAPGERYEILVDLSGDAVGSTLDLQSFNGPGSGLSFGFAGFENASGGEFGSLLNYKTFSVLRISVRAATAMPAAPVPATLVSNAYPGTGDATRSRSVNITGGMMGMPFTFDGRGFDMDRIDQAVTAGNVESWTISGGMVFGHSFHIHGVQFKIVARNGSAGNIKAYEQGWKDTIYLPIRETLTFVARFDETADEHYPFMYHCHMVNHEDDGLMGQFTVK